MDHSSQSLWDADFSVEQLANNRQSFEVYASGDDDRMNVGWYEATDKKIFPRYHKFYFGPGLALKVLPIAVTMTVVICIWEFGAHNVNDGYRPPKYHSHL